MRHKFKPIVLLPVAIFMLSVIFNACKKDGSPGVSRNDTTYLLSAITGEGVGLLDSFEYDDNTLRLNTIIIPVNYCDRTSASEIKCIKPCVVACKLYLRLRIKG